MLFRKGIPLKKYRELLLEVMKIDENKTKENYEQENRKMIDFHATFENYREFSAPCTTMRILSWTTALKLRGWTNSSPYW